MANTINLSVSLIASAASGTYQQSRQPSVQINQTNVGASAGIMACTTSYAALPLGSVSSANQGWLYLRNLDNTNNAMVGLNVSATYYPFAQIQPGEVAVFRVQPSVTLGLAGTVALNVEYWLLAN